jgi:hypothetical protein
MHTDELQHCMVNILAKLIQNGAISFADKLWRTVNRLKNDKGMHFRFLF